MRQKAHDEHALRMHADLHIRKISGGPAVGELRVSQFVVVIEPEALAARALGLLYGLAHLAATCR
jgi:hypothetical protein